MKQLAEPHEVEVEKTKRLFEIIKFVRYVRAEYGIARYNPFRELNLEHLIIQALSPFPFNEDIIEINIEEAFMERYLPYLFLANYHARKICLYLEN